MHRLVQLDDYRQPKKVQPASIEERAEWIAEAVCLLRGLGDVALRDAVGVLRR